jgi:hypothetical protein
MDVTRLTPADQWQNLATVQSLLAQNKPVTIEQDAIYLGALQAVMIAAGTAAAWDAAWHTVPCVDGYYQIEFSGDYPTAPQPSKSHGGFGGFGVLMSGDSDGSNLHKLLNKNKWAQWILDGIAAIPLMVTGEGLAEMVLMPEAATLTAGGDIGAGAARVVATRVPRTWIFG